ncbi:MAG: sigma-70 family RNA polymerase sigma factor [Bacteroidota bacterium]|nr:sigma-70 family RNA polymerase sigma factor [Bacteroidota bacterium]
MGVESNLTEKAQRDLILIKSALKTGDTKAYTKLMQIYRDPIFFMLKEKIKNEEIAKDLTIETLGKAFKKLHLYQPDFAFSTWLFTIARNNCIDYLRKNKLPTISIDKVSINSDGSKHTLDLPSSDPNPELAIIKKQRVRILREIVEKLKPKYRDLVKLRYFKELSYDEISKELTLPLGTIKAQLHRAREQLFNIVSGQQDSI